MGRIAVVMATYNGERFLAQQLQSIAQQTVLPDELLVFDDGSDDNTPDIIERFAEAAPFDVRFEINHENLGSSANFARLLGATSGDVVFLSDQDDVWLPAKIERMIAEFGSYDEPLLTMCDAEIVDASGTRTGLTKRGQTHRLGLTDQHFITGCCMALSRGLLRIVNPVRADVMAHDKWISEIAGRLELKRVMADVLHLYRRHDVNASDWLASKQRRVSRLDRLFRDGGSDSRQMNLERQQRLDRLADRMRARASDMNAMGVSATAFRQAQQDLAVELRAVENRLRLLERPRYRRLAPALRMLRAGEYDTFSGTNSFLKDLARR